MTALTIGVFDGVHRGHQHLFSALLALGAQKTQAITFSNHPNDILSPQKSPYPLTPLPLKLALLSECGIDEITPLFFTQELSKLPFTEFLAPYSFDHLVIGDDAAIGHGRLGTPDALRLLGLQRGFKVHVLPKLTNNQEVLSSTLIRDSILRGELKKAEELLGRPYCFTISSSKKHALLPPDGQYPVWAHSSSGIIQTTVKIQNSVPMIALESPQLISFGPNLNPKLFERLCQQTSLAAL